jgi:hypothetical protein
MDGEESIEPKSDVKGNFSESFSFVLNVMIIPSIWVLQDEKN